MNKIIAWSCGAVIVLAMVAASLSTHANTNVSTETVQTLEDSINDTIEALMEEELFTIDNTDQFVAAFLQGLLQKVESDSEIRVEVLGADATTGLLSMRVIEVFRQPSGKESTISCDCAVIFDRKASGTPEPDLVSVTFYYDGETRTEEGIYKKYGVKSGSVLTLPQNPVPLSGEAVFLGWENAATGQLHTGEVSVDGELVFHGVWEQP